MFVASDSSYYVMPAYAKPPITEAVVEFRFAATQNEKKITRARGRLKEKYVLDETQNLVNFTIAPNTQPHISSAFSGIRLSRLDQDEIAVLSASAFSRSMLPPYKGWPSFRDSIIEDWESIDKLYDFKHLSRIGMRYINRIDIPLAGRPQFEMDDYLSIRVEIPVLHHGPMLEQTARVVMPLQDSRYLCYINYALGASPLLDHAALILDIEISTDQFPEKNSQAIWTTLDALRTHKNVVFEACITDMARQLFGTK